MANKRRVLQIGLAVFWLALTSTLIVWWMRFALNLILQFDPGQTRFRAMLLWEGATLLALLILGGGTLIYFIVREADQFERLRTFLAHFSHELKTSLAGVRLQTESLKADNRDASLADLIDRLATDTSRLQNQVENSLFVGGSESRSLYSEEIDLKGLIEILRDSWPRLKIEVVGNAHLRADRRAIESILNNLFHNAIVHGGATLVKIAVQALANGIVELRIEDNGAGFQGDLSQLGQVFYRPNSRSGSGLGLYTVKSYVIRQGGQVEFSTSPQGFLVILKWPGAMA
jgi:signal transduction histidine kinase